MQKHIASLEEFALREIETHNKTAIIAYICSISIIIVVGLDVFFIMNDMNTIYMNALYSLMIGILIPLLALIGLICDILAVYQGNKKVFTALSLLFNGFFTICMIGSMFHFI